MSAFIKIINPDFIKAAAGRAEKKCGINKYTLYLRMQEITNEFYKDSCGVDYVINFALLQYETLLSYNFTSINRTNRCVFI